jgi:hypothetical protein
MRVLPTINKSGLGNKKAGLIIICLLRAMISKRHRKNAMPAFKGHPSKKDRFIFGRRGFFVNSREIGK